MNLQKLATPDHPIHELLPQRWSPYGFADRPVSEADLRSLFEAARWSASSYNAQPWSYIVATKSDRAAFDLLLSCLVAFVTTLIPDVGYDHLFSVMRFRDRSCSQVDLRGL